MPRYINAERLIRVLATDCGDAIDALKKFESDEKASVYWEAYKTGLMDAIARVVEEPIANVRENVHGHWVIKYNPETHWYQVTCSNCGEDVTSTIPLIGFFPNVRPMWDYCPECGAMMDEENE
mgnify:CR=1 FL=1